MHIGVLLLGVSVVFLSLMPSGSQIRRDALKTTHERMEKIEIAMLGYMAFHHHRPCPANIMLAQDDPEFGKVKEDCAYANFNYAGTIYAGGIPTQEIGIPNDYAFDGFGRRMVYVVDKKVTGKDECLDFLANGEKGAIKIVDAFITDPKNPLYPVARDYPVLAYISYGPDGHGAFPAAGGSLANRINTGATDADTSTNAFIGANFSTILMTDKLVQKEPTAAFDDIVWYLDATKHTCCLGTGCVKK